MYRCFVAAAGLLAGCFLAGCGSCGGSSQPVTDGDAGAVFLQDPDGGRRIRLRNGPARLLILEAEAGAPP